MFILYQICWISGWLYLTCCVLVIVCICSLRDHQQNFNISRIWFGGKWIFCTQFIDSISIRSLCFYSIGANFILMPSSNSYTRRQPRKEETTTGAITKTATSIWSTPRRRRQQQQQQQQPLTPVDDAELAGAQNIVGENVVELRNILFFDDRKLKKKTEIDEIFDVTMVRNGKKLSTFPQARESERAERAREAKCGVRSKWMSEWCEWAVRVCGASERCEWAVRVSSASEWCKRTSEWKASDPELQSLLLFILAHIGWW